MRNEDHQICILTFGKTKHPGIPWVYNSITTTTIEQTHRRLIELRPFVREIIYLSKQAANSI